MLIKTKRKGKGEIIPDVEARNAEAFLNFASRARQLSVEQKGGAVASLRSETHSKRACE